MSEAVWEKGLYIIPKRTKLLHKRLSWFKTFWILVALALVVLSVNFYRSLPSMTDIETLLPVSAKIMDRNGKILYEIYGEHRRTPVALEQISPFLQKATVAAEDKDFYNHGPISLPAIIRAAYVNYKEGAVVQGGSTISQQVIKNTLLTRDRSFKRKAKEALFAFQLEYNYSKDQILQIYLNSVPYGRNTYGAEAAAQAYFAKSAKDLDLAESAYLAALPKAPSYYSPAANFKALKERQIYILNAMEGLGFITYDENLNAQKQKVVFKSGAVPMVAPYFVKWLEQDLAQKYGKKDLEEEGFVIYTSLDLDLQQQAEKAIEEGVAKNSKKHGAYNAALVAMDPNNGQVLAMVGGAGYFNPPLPSGCSPGRNCRFDPQVNAAVSPRQPGSSFKPYTYVTAFSPEFGFAPASPIMDMRQNFAPPGIAAYNPSNFDGKSYGLISMRKALAGSLNVPAVRTLSMIGVDSVVKTAQRLGITTPLKNCGLSLTLGACEVKLVDHVAGFGAFANGGKKVTPTAVIKITDKKGSIIEDNSGQTAGEQVLNPQAVYELISILNDNQARSFIFGSRSPLVFNDRPVAAKTGTSQDFKDGWTLGFTPQLVTGVWVGNNDGALIKNKGDGVVVAAPIWNQFMKNALKDKPVLAFSKPEGIQEVLVSKRSAKLATQYTPDPVKEIFADYSVPTIFDSARPTETPTSTEPSSPTLIANPTIPIFDSNNKISNAVLPPSVVPIVQPNSVP